MRDEKEMVEAINSLNGYISTAIVNFVNIQTMRGGSAAGFSAKDISYVLICSLNIILIQEREIFKEM